MPNPGVFLHGLPSTQGKQLLLLPPVKLYLHQKMPLALPEPASWPKCTEHIFQVRSSVSLRHASTCKWHSWLTQTRIYFSQVTGSPAVQEQLLFILWLDCAKGWGLRDSLSLSFMIVISLSQLVAWDLGFLSIFRAEKSGESNTTGLHLVLFFQESNSQPKEAGRWVELFQAPLQEEARHWMNIARKGPASHWCQSWYILQMKWKSKHHRKNMKPGVHLFFSQLKYTWFTVSC